MRTTLPFVSVVLALVSILKADAPAAGDESKYAPMPWHLIDTWWDLGKDMPFESLSVDVTIDTDIPSTVNLYISPIGLGHLSGTAFYGGIQSQSDGSTKKDSRLRQIGPGFLFSMWGERSLDAIRPADGGFCQSSGHEGDFVSVRRPYEWKKGAYTYRLSKMDRQIIDGQPFTWVGAFVESHETGENLFVGALRFKGENFTLDRRIANFVEIYGPRRPVADIPKVTITFAKPVINGQPVDGVTASATYPKGVPDYADAVAQGDRIVVTVGKPVENRQDRHVSLISRPQP